MRVLDLWIFRGVENRRPKDTPLHKYVYIYIIFSQYMDLQKGPILVVGGPSNIYPKLQDLASNDC